MEPLFGPTNRTRTGTGDIQKLVQMACTNCYDRYNLKDRKPYVVAPCQHMYCYHCVNNEIFSKKEPACPECQRPAKKEDARPAKSLIKLMGWLEKYRQEKVENVEERLALQLFNDPDMECPKCLQKYDTDLKLPVVTCVEQHILCSVCLRTVDSCKPCKRPLNRDYRAYSKVLMSLNEFSNKVQFMKKVIFRFREGNFFLTVVETVTIKDIFHTLQEFKHLPESLEISVCRFYIQIGEQAYNLKRKQVDYRSRIDQITKDKNLTIQVQCSEDALLKSKITISSKIIADLPIKLNAFRPQERLEDNEIFGLEVKSEIMNEKYKEKPQENPQKKSSLEYLDKKQSSNKNLSGPIENQKKEDESRLPKRKDLTQISKFRSRIFDEEQEKISKLKKLRIPYRKEEPVGSLIQAKTMEAANTSKPEVLRADVLKKFLATHEVSPEDERLLCFLAYQEMNKEHTKQEEKESLELQQELRAKAKSGDRLSLILIALKGELASEDLKVSFSRKSSPRSQLTLKTLTSHFITDRLIIEQKMEEDETWTFQRLYEGSQQETLTFLDFQRKKISECYGVSPQSLVFHEIIKGSITVRVSTNEGGNVVDNIRKNLRRDISLHPYFKQLELCPQDFDASGNFSFPEKKNKVQFRGNWPYYQPIKCVRHGILVSDQFDGGNNQWLEMKNKPGEWVVGFHGIRNPNQAYKNYKNSILSILSGLYRPDQSMIIVVENSRQAYQNHDCARGGKVGAGVYLTPSFKTALSYTSPSFVEGKNFRLVFQCRLRPQGIKIPRGKEDYWVVNKSQDIRPYGIILIEESVAQSYPSIEVQFGSTFRYSDYRNQIENIAQ